MKRLTTFLLTLFLITLGASAQTDYTWALNCGTWTGNTGFYGDGAVAVERYGDEIAVSGDPVKVLYETVTDLPAGEYTLTFYAVANNAWVGAAVGDNIAQVYVTSNEVTQTEDVTVYDQTGCTLSDYPHTFTVEVGEDGTLEYGLQNIATGGNWYVAQGVSLIYSETYEPVAGDKVYGCKAEIGHWTATNTGAEAFQKNTWSAATGMSIPTCEYWVYNTSNLTAATISHKTIVDLPAGTYEISIAASATAENSAGSVGEGTTFNVNGESVDLTTGTFSTPTGMGGNYSGTYTLTVTIEEGGSLDISIVVPEGATYNWLQFQDLSVTYLGEAEPEPESSAYVFVCTDWGSIDLGRVSDDNVTYDETNNTITVVASGTNNVALSNGREAPFTTADMTVTNLQCWYTVVGTNISTADGDSKLWWMNGANWGEWDPTAVVELEDGQVLVTWDLSTMTEIDVNLLGDENYLDGWTGFGLTSTTGTSVISDINFYTEEELQAIIGSDEEPGIEEPTDIDSDYHIGDVIEAQDGKSYTVLGENLVPNHSFELGYEGWTNASDFTTEITSTYFKLETAEGDADQISGNQYLVGTGWGGSSSDKSLGTAWAIEEGKTYYLSYNIKNLNNQEETEYLKTSLTNTPGDEDSNNVLGYPASVSADWQTEEYVFDSGSFNYVQIKFRWLATESGVANWGLDNFQIYEVEEIEVEPEPTPEPVVEEGDYLIVDADGNYLGGGLVYGTQAATIGKPQFIGFEVQDDGTYHLDSHQYNNATNHYLGSNLYFDSTPVDWTLAEVDGGYTIYGTVDTGTGYLTSNGFQTEASVEADPYVWTLVTMDDVIAGMDEATADAPVDVTALIAAPELKRNSNSSYYPTWTVTGYDGTGTPSNYAFGGNNAIASCAESYHSTNGFNFSQEITLPLAGTYTLSAQGFYRDDNSTTLLLPVMYVDEESVEFPEITRTDEYLGVADNMANAYQEFLLGLHPIDAITVTAEEDGQTVTIGFKGEDTSLWQIMGELTLLYLGEEEAPEPTEIVDIHECVAEFDHWSIAGNSGGAFQLNTWSTEADESGMKTPFIEYWVGTGNILSNATISHTQLTDLEDGYYSVSIFARAFNEGSSTPVSEGITFTANEESIDLTSGTTATYNNASEEVYGTYTLLVYVTGGTLDIGFTVADLTACDWVAFKNLSVEYFGAEMPTLAAVSGVMNAEVEATMQDAVDAYNADKTLDNYYAAVEAIEEAEASIDYYAPIVEVVDALDEDGAAVWAESDYAAMLEARTLTNEDVSADLAAAQKAQTTAGSDMTYAVQNSGAWGADQGNGPASYSTFATETYIGSGEAAAGTVLYKTIEGLTAGTYTVSFYVAANMANGISGDSGDGITEAYANNGDVVAITVGTNSAAQIASLEDMTLVTITCTVGSDGVLVFGLQNVAAGGNWFLGAACSLTLNEVLDEDLADLILRYNDDCEAAEECEANLADMIENGDKTSETKAEMAEALEALEAVMAEYGGIDTSDVSAIDVDELTAACEAIEAALAEAQNVYATGLQSVTVATESNAIYTLSGVRLNKITKSGIYIVDGKKVLVK